MGCFPEAPPQHRLMSPLDADDYAALRFAEGRTTGRLPRSAGEVRSSSTPLARRPAPRRVPREKQWPTPRCGSFNQGRSPSRWCRGQTQKTHAGVGGRDGFQAFAQRAAPDWNSEPGRVAISRHPLG